MTTLFIIGDGPLGRELAALATQAGHAVTPYWLDEEEGEAPLGESLEAALGDGITLAIEAVSAEPTDKWDAMTELDRLLPPELPLLTAALNATATEVASWCRAPQRVVGFAALPPLAEQRVIELLPALQSDAASIEAAQRFWQSLGREPVTVADSVAGVVPRVVCNLINEAALALMEGVATREDIDLAMRLGTNWPRGPLAWADLIGVEQVVAILEALGEEFGPESYRPAPLLRQMARAEKRFYAAGS